MPRATLRYGGRYHFGPTDRLFELGVGQDVGEAEAAALAADRTVDARGNDVAYFEIEAAAPAVADEAPAAEPATAEQAAAASSAGSVEGGE